MWRRVDIFNRMEKFITANNCALRISDTLRGDSVVVLLHGYLESIEVWDDFIPLLKAHFRVVAPDLPGHGISEVRGPVHTMEFMADTVAAALTTLGIDKFLLVGHSMGGYVALELLRKYPERLTGLVLLHSTPNPDGEAKKEARLREIELVEQGKKDLMARMNVEKRFAADNLQKFADTIDELAMQVTLTEEDGVTAALRGMMERRDNNATMRNSPVPQLVILGRRDEHISAEVAEALVAAQPQAQVVWLDNSGHMGFIEEPERCAEAIIQLKVES